MDPNATPTTPIATDTPASAVLDPSATLTTPVPNDALSAVLDTPHAYGLEAFLQQADAVTWTVLAILLVMSILSWQVMVYRSVALFWVRWRTERSLLRFLTAASLPAGAQTLSDRERGPCARLAGIAAMSTRHVQRHASEGRAGGLSHADLLARLLADGLGDERARLEEGLTLLASVGSTAPFIGLFGTVWGIHHALVRIGMSGQATIDQIAGPVGEALIMTAIGLAVAVPAVFGYNAILRGNNRLLGRLQGIASGLLIYATTGAYPTFPGKAAKPRAAEGMVEAPA